MESAGARLKKLRLEKGVSLEEAQKKTKIHINLLKAIEGDSLTDVDPVYLRGFLKIYCKFLGVDPKDYIADYKETPAYAGRAGLGYTQEQGKPQGSLMPSRRIIMALVRGLVIIAVAMALFKLGRNISLKRQARLSSQDIVRLEKIRVNKKTKTQTKPKATPPLTRKEAVPQPNTLVLNKEAFSGIRLVIRARDNCWVSLKVDGRLVFQRVLEKGRFESWKAKEKIELSLGNAAAAELEVNGQLFTNLGRKGQPRKNILITKEGLSASR